MAFDVDWFLLFHSIDDPAMARFLATDRTGRFGGCVTHRSRLKGLCACSQFGGAGGGGVESAAEGFLHAGGVVWLKVMKRGPLEPLITLIDIEHQTQKQRCVARNAKL